MKRRTILTGAASLAATTLLGSQARAAEPYPVKPITILVPQAPGGANDVIGRALAQKLAVVFGSPVVVENRVGAGGNVGTVHVARQPKDGYTLLLNAQSVQTINPFLYRKVGFDPVKDFDPVMVVGVVLPGTMRRTPVVSVQYTEAPLVASGESTVAVASCCVCLVVRSTTKRSLAVACNELRPLTKSRSPTSAVDITY